MKREFPALYAKASMTVATPLIGLVTIFYVTSAINEPAADVYRMALAAFGVTAALSGICLTVSEPIDGLSNIRYAGEKFLHSSLLLIQTAIVIYLKNAVSASDWLSKHPWISSSARALTLGLLGLLSAAAAVAWYFGFAAVNSQLWQNWERRIENTDRTASTDAPAKSAKTKSTT
jgi:hypothetical protein